MERQGMGSKHIIDAVVVGAYLVLSFVFGIFATKILKMGEVKGDENDEENYFLAGRKMSGWINGVSNAVTAMNADMAPAYYGVAVVMGLSMCWFYMSNYALCMLVLGLLFGAKWRQLRVLTGPEFFTLRFGGTGGKFVRVWSSITTVFIGMVPWIGAGMLGVHVIFGPIFGIDSKAVTLLIVLPVIVIYVWVNGFVGVIVTDAMQTAVIILAHLVLTIIVLMKFGGPIGLVEAIKSAHASNISHEILSILPKPGHRVFGPLMVLIWGIVFTVGSGGNVGSEGQRMISCRDSKEAAKVGVWSNIAYFAMLMLMTLPAMGTLADHPEFYAATPTEREMAYAIALNDYLPTGFLGLALAALLAAVMSTISTHMNYGAQTLMNDVYRPLFNKDLSGNAAVWMGRLLMLVVLGSSIAVVYFAKSLLGIAVIMGGLFGSTAVMSWGQWWWWRVNFWSWIAANIGGPIVYLLLGWILQFIPWWAEHLRMNESMAQQLGMLQAMGGMVLAAVLWVIVALFTKPTDMEILKQFYRRARPMGAWGPVRDAVEAEDGDKALPREPKHLIMSGFGVSFVGLTWTWLAILACSELFVGRYFAAAWMGLSAAAIGWIFKRMFDWYLERLTRNDAAHNKLLGITE
jgi:Na+/proline symporter